MISNKNLQWNRNVFDFLRCLDPFYERKPEKKNDMESKIDFKPELRFKNSSFIAVS